MITTPEQFIDRIRSLENISDAYEVFEFECADNLRDVILNCADPNSQEPFRSAMHFLGYTNY